MKASNPRYGRIAHTKGRILIASAILDAWGGSEELWSAAVPHLQEMGFQVLLAKSVIHHEHPKIAHHLRHGVIPLETEPDLTIPCRLWNRLRKEWHKFRGIDRRLPGFAQTAMVRRFKKQLATYKPNLVLLSQGINFDGMGYAYACMDMNIPYVIVSHKAVESFWPWPADRDCIGEIFLKAKACFFVSQHNKRLTEEQFGMALPHGTVIFNPVKMTAAIPYPEVASVFRVCCIGRLVLMDKGQDILLRILSKPVWKSRPLHLTIYGQGPDEAGLKSLARFLGVNQVTFAGFNGDIAEVWRHQHALAVPSRCEGLPLTIVEAMKVGRPVITTNAGGSAELLADGMTGFVGHCNQESFEAAMERAWESRFRWEQIGLQAQKAVEEIFPASPELEFVQLLKAHL